MKKIYSYLCYAAMAIAAVSFASCGDDDDNDGPKKEPTPEVQKVQIYAATIGNETLEVLDIKLNMYRNGQKQVVVLDKSMIAPYVPSASYLPRFEYMNTYYCASVNGVEGVDSVIPEVAVKPNLEEIIASKDPNGKCTCTCFGEILKVNKAADGNYSGNCIPEHCSTYSWKQIFDTGRNGIVNYENIRADAQDALTAK